MSSGIEYFTFPPNVTNTSAEVLRECDSLKGVEINASCSSLDGCFCFNSLNIKWVRCLPTTPPLQNAFGGAYSFFPTNGNSYKTLKLYVPEDSLESYKTDTRWSAFADRTFPLSNFHIDFPDDAEELGIS